MGRWMSPQRAAVYADTSVNAVKRALADGSLVGYRKPWNERYLTVHTDDVDAWVRSWRKASDPLDAEVA